MIEACLVATMACFIAEVLLVAFHRYPFRTSDFAQQPYQLEVC
jgi:hypothetical protein